MNIVFLIGNGFDINLGMKTSYADFYDDYTKTYRTTSEPINRMMDSIAQYKTNNLWADLEKGLGEYTSNISSVKELREVYFHLNETLMAYLKHQEIDTKYLTSDAANKLKIDLMNPHMGFRQRLRQEIMSFMNLGGVAQDDVHIITFNYTKTIEMIMAAGELKIPAVLGTKNNSGSKTVLQSINHIHGTLSDPELIMGVNDKSQILNEQFANDPSALSMLVKPETTINRGDMLDDKCEFIVAHADLFCLFGLSLGETDQKWWDLLSQRFVSSNVHIIYFAHDNRKIIHNQDLWDIEREYRELLLDKFAGKVDKTALSTRIHVLVNSAMFKLE